MQVSTAAVMIKTLRETFCRFSLPRVIVSENGPQYIASEFNPLNANGIFIYIFHAHDFYYMYMCHVIMILSNVLIINPVKRYMCTYMYVTLL